MDNNFFGKSNFSGGGTESTRATFYKLGHDKPEKRSLVMRIAPPYGPLAAKGTWAVYVKQHFGYSIKVPGKAGSSEFSIPQTFLCIEKKDREGNITTPCPECNEIAIQKKRLEDKKAALAKEGKSEEEIAAATQYIASWLKQHNLDKKWNLVAKNLEGKWGFLTISHACYKLLKGNDKAPGLIDNLLAKGVDPTAPEKGSWIQFRRNGIQWNEITDIPSEYTEEVVVEGESLSRAKRDSLTQADMDALAKLQALDTLGRTLSHDAIKMLVDSGGEESVVRTVMSLPTNSRSSAESTQVAAPSMAAPKAAPETSVEASPEPVDEEAQLLAALEAARARKAKQAAPAQVQPQVVADQPVLSPKLASTLELSEAELIAKYSGK